MKGVFCGTGFGSLIVDDRERVTQKILDAFVETGQRLLLSKGWANLGEGFDLPDTVMLLVDTPHDWLLPKCSAVVHHGGAGTTAAGRLPPLVKSISIVGLHQHLQSMGHKGVTSFPYAMNFSLEALLC